MISHIVLIHARYIREILAGSKTVECRLLRQRVPPLGRVSAGEEIYIKCVGGPFAARALVRRVREWSDLTPAGVEEIRQKYNDRIGAPAPFWAAKADARWATLIWLADVRPTAEGPDYAHLRARRPRAGWFVLDQAGSDMRTAKSSIAAVAARHATPPSATDVSSATPRVPAARARGRR